MSTIITPPPVQQSPDYVPPSQPPRKSHRLFALIGIGVLVLGAGIGVGVAAGGHHSSPAASPSPSISQSAPVTAPPVAAPPVAAPSPALDLSVGQIVTILMGHTAADGTTVTGVAMIGSPAESGGVETANVDITYSDGTIWAQTFTYVAATGHWTTDAGTEIGSLQVSLLAMVISGDGRGLFKVHGCSIRGLALRNPSFARVSAPESGENTPVPNGTWYHPPAPARTPGLGLNLR